MDEMNEFKKVSTDNGEKRTQKSPLKTIHLWRIHRDLLNRRGQATTGGE